jgi:hypothetical protein
VRESTWMISVGVIEGAVVGAAPSSILILGLVGKAAR